MKSSYLPANLAFTEHIHVAATADGHDPGASRDPLLAAGRSVDFGNSSKD